ncbi:MAG: LuxR C-terminal-related transcriptional regulator, partial [Bacillota bacterium]|nr:LuxR C-terminal-related transcriptional regulator [Bacillota bacterium]
TLSGALEHKMTLIKGAAGSGKTTLMASFIKDIKLDCKWISLDRDNNDIYSFWYYLTEAVKDYLGESREDIIALFNAMLDKDDIERLLIILINQLNIETEIMIVLDDFHNITEPYLLQTVEYFIKHSSDNIHLVALTREEPKLYLADLIMSGDLLQINEEDLKFTSSEGISFLRNTLQINQNDETLKEMNVLSEGWIGGLQLIALAASNKNTSIKDIKIMNKYVVEYLTKEIVDSLSETEKEFLIKTSFLGYFNQSICNEILGRRDCGDLIQSLSDKNLFLINIDEERGVYRYHNIFGEFLKLRFSKLDEDERRALRLKASEIFIGYGDYDEAIAHLLETGSYDEALRVIGLMGQNYKAWAYLAQIPLSRIKDDRDMVIQRLFYHYYSNDIDNLGNLFDELKERMENDEYWKVLKIAKSILLNLDLKTDLMSFEEIENMKLSDVTKSILYIKTAAFLFMQFKLEEALECAEKAERLESGGNNIYIKMSILSIKSSSKEELGNLVECESIYEEIFSLVENNKFLSHLYMNLYVGITGIYLKSGRLEKAEDALNKGMNLAYKTNIYTDAGYLYNLMELKLLQGLKEEAYEIARKLLDIEVYKNLLFASSLIKYILYMNKMTTEIAQNYIKAYLECEAKYIRIEDTLTYARILDFLGREKEALELTDEILQVVRSSKIKFKLVEALLFKIKILARRENAGNREIINLMREAIYYSFENHIASPYILEGPEILKYLVLLSEEKNKDLNSKERIFINEISGYFKKDNSVEILSERELEVLNELATGASNKEIGERLCISVSTVKTHIINIYSKLQVGSRVEAVEKARKLEIIK